MWRHFTFLYKSSSWTSKEVYKTSQNAPSARSPGWPGSVPCRFGRASDVVVWCRRATNLCRFRLDWTTMSASNQRVTHPTHGRSRRITTEEWLALLCPLPYGGAFCSPSVRLSVCPVHGSDRINYSAAPENPSEGQHSRKRVQQLKNVKSHVFGFWKKT